MSVGTGYKEVTSFSDEDLGRMVVYRTALSKKPVGHGRIVELTKSGKAAIQMAGSGGIIVLLPEYVSFDKRRY